VPCAVPQCVQSALTCHAYHFGVRFTNRRTLLVGALAVLVAGVVGYGLLHQSKPDERAGLTPGFKTYAPPALAGSTLAGAKLSLVDLRGKPTFLNFWQSYCGPCQDEARQLTSFTRTLEGRANFVGVDVQDGRHEALAFVHKYDWSYPQLPVSDIELVERFGVVGFPTTLVLNSQGKVVDKIVGPTTARALTLKLAAVNASHTA
jgi:cytochrome c biogenesis protein CcmG, thiol:disulfide interchange protein DsbE